MYGVSSLTTYVNAHATGLRLFTHQNQMVFQVTEGQDNFPVVNRHTYECMHVTTYVHYLQNALARNDRKVWSACNTLYLVCILVSLSCLMPPRLRFCIILPL